MSEFIPNGCLSVLQARDLVGKRMYGAGWLGIAEYQNRAHVESDPAKAAEIYAPAKAVGVKLMALLYGSAPKFRDAIKADVRVASGAIYPLPPHIWGSAQRADFLVNGRARSIGGYAMDWEPAPAVPNNYPWRHEGPILIDEAQLLAAIPAIAPATKLAASDSPAAVQPPPKKGERHADRNKQWGEWAMEELMRSPNLGLKALVKRVHECAKDESITVGTVQRCLGKMGGIGRLKAEAAKLKAAAQKAGG